MAEQSMTNADGRVLTVHADANVVWVSIQHPDGNALGWQVTQAQAQQMLNTLQTAFKGVWPGIT